MVTYVCILIYIYICICSHIYIYMYIYTCLHRCLISHSIKHISFLDSPFAFIIPILECPFLVDFCPFLNTIY